MALGVTPETVSSPTTPREFASSLINGVDRNGDLQTGLAMEVAPYQIFNGKNVTPARYRDEWWTRVFYNTSLSIGTIKAAEDKKAVKLAVGLSITLWDKGDELMREKSLEILNGVFSQVEVPDYNPFLSEEENKAAQDAWISAAKEMSKSYDKQIAEARKKIWGKSAWNVAWAPTWRSGTGKYDELQYDGSTVWTTYAYGFENLALEGKCQVFAHLRYRDGEEVADPNDATKTATQRSLLAAGRIRWGQPDMNWNVEGGYLKLWGGPGGGGDAWRLAGGFERKVAENVWFVIQAGQDFGQGNAQDNSFALGSFRFGSNDSPNYKP